MAHDDLTTSQTPPSARTVTARRLGWPTYVGLAVAMGWPFIFLALGHDGVPKLADRSLDQTVIIKEWFASAVVLAIMLFGERLTFRSVGLKWPRWTDFGPMFLMLLATFVGNGIALTIATALAGHPPPYVAAGVLAIPLALRAAVAVTAGMCEEFLCRGYAIERLTALTGNRFIGAAVPCVLFTLGHVRLYGFGLGLLPVFATAIALTTLYVWRRNLVLNMLMHAVLDLYGLLLQPLVNHSGP